MAETTASGTEEIVLYSDYVCPFCYLGREILDRYLSSTDLNVVVDWHPFDLRSQKRDPNGEIDESVDDGKDGEYYEEAQRNVDRLSKKYGVEMLGIHESPDVDSLNAQAASLHVKDEYPDRWEAFDKAVFEALWVDGRDIGDVDVLAEIAESAGVSGDEVREMANDADLQDRLFRMFGDAQEEGIRGVPTFVYGEHFCRGAVPPEQLRRLVEA